MTCLLFFYFIIIIVSIINTINTSIWSFFSSSYSNSTTATVLSGTCFFLSLLQFLEWGIVVSQWWYETDLSSPHTSSRFEIPNMRFYVLHSPLIFMKMLKWWLPKYIAFAVGSSSVWCRCCIQKLIICTILHLPRMPNMWYIGYSQCMYCFMFYRCTHPHLEYVHRWWKSM